MPFFNFSVDSALLRELGERLVGKPHIALAELVKNGYDADANSVNIEIEDNQIEVSDDGHGMTSDEFRDFWMRIGSPHKGEAQLSRKLKRPLTGSKGVGRLAGQFLARKMRIHTVSSENSNIELIGEVDWEKATAAGELTSAQVEYEERERETVFAGGATHGTRIVLYDLNQDWGEEDVRDLAREVWMLQPPFRANPKLDADKSHSFDVSIQSADKALTESFENQMRAILSLFQVRISGHITKIRRDGTGEVELAIEWSDGATDKQTYGLPNCKLRDAGFKILVYSLHQRQRHGIRVGEAREYLNKYGGVHIYDAGFHLPYYGHEQDWLGIELDCTPTFPGPQAPRDAEVRKAIS